MTIEDYHYYTDKYGNTDGYEWKDKTQAAANKIVAGDYRDFRELAREFAMGKKSVSKSQCGEKIKQLFIFKYPDYNTDMIDWSDIGRDFLETVGVGQGRTQTTTIRISKD